MVLLLIIRIVPERKSTSLKHHISLLISSFFFVLRMFLCLFAGGQVQQLPTGLTGEEGSEELPTQARYDKER